MTLKLSKSIALSLTLAISIGSVCQEAVFADPLQGSIDQTDIEPSTVEKAAPTFSMPTPVLPASASKDKLRAGEGTLDSQNALKGKADDQALEGTVEDEGDIEFRRRFGSLDKPKNTLQGNANKDALKATVSKDESTLQSQDPDFGDQELAIAWDKWRNRFLWSVQSGVTQAMNDPDNPQIRWDPQSQTMVSKFPMGTIAWFSCKISNDRKISNLKLLHSSGFPEYDQAVLNSVQALDGSAILKFPARSRRPWVSQNAGIKTAASGGRQFFKFGDVERYNVQP